MLKRTNIAAELAKVTERKYPQDSILKEISLYLQEDEPREVTSIPALRTTAGPGNNSFVFDKLESSRICHLREIREICIDYRLRFLDLKYFKGALPREAEEEIFRLEDEHGIRLQGFKILAPSRLFKLEDKDDPVLFAPIGNGYFYRVHKWGNDLHPFRKLYAWPFKNIVNLALVVLALSYLLTLLIPDGLFSPRGATAEFWIIFFFMFKSIAAVVIFYGFALGKNFNPAIWNSKYYNA